jgi:hypothetical protein
MVRQQHVCLGKRALLARKSKHFHYLLRISRVSAYITVKVMLMIFISNSSLEGSTIVVNYSEFQLLVAGYRR